MNEQQHQMDKPQPRAYFMAYEDHLDYLQSGMETQLPAADKNGVLGVLELGGKTDSDNHMFVDKSGSRMVLIDIDKARESALAELVSQYDPESTPKGSVAALDLRSLERADTEAGFSKGIMLLTPQEEAHTLGRREHSSKETFGWDEHTAGGISARHLDIRVSSEGVFVRDRDSTNGTVLATGEYVNQIIDRTPEHHEHVARIKQLLGVEAVEDTVVMPNIAAGTMDGSAVERIEPAATEKLEDRPRPTFEAAKERAAAMIANGGNASILAADLLKLGDTPEAIVRELGVNPEVRDEVRSALMMRLNMLLDEMPHQIQVNAEKNVTNWKEHGYKAKMRSQEYAVEIALSYLDGTFNTQLEARDGHGKSGIGEHRTAAQRVLESFAQKVPGKVERLEFGEDLLRAYATELRSKLDETTVDFQELSSEGGSIYVLRELLQHDRIDPDNIAEISVRIDRAIDNALDIANRESYKLANLQGRASFNENIADAEHTQAIQEKFTLLIHHLSDIRNSWSASMLSSAAQGIMDQMGVLQLQAAYRNGNLDEDYLGQIERIPVFLQEFMDQLA